MKETKNRVKKIAENILSLFKTPVPQVMERLSYIEDKLSEMDCRVNSNTKSFLHLQNGQGGFPGVSKESTANIFTYFLDDDIEDNEQFSNILKENGFTDIKFFSDKEKFMSSISADINLCFIDHRLPGTTGLEVLKEVKARNSNSYVVIVSGQTDRQVVIQYLNEGADKYIDKNEVENYFEVLIEYLKDGVAEAARRVAIVKFLEEKMKQ